MTRIAYVNGRYVPQIEAMVRIEDRGFLLADGIYEVCLVRGGRIIDEDAHMDRLERSMREIKLTPPMGRPALMHVTREVLRRNGIRDGAYYLQVTRGAARRDHAFPNPPVPPTLAITAWRHPGPPAAAIRDGVAAVTIPDQRWGRCDIKSVGLLPNALGKQQAREAGAYEAVMTDGQGTVTEGTSANIWLVGRSGEIATHPLGPRILGGITRQSLLRVAAESQIQVAERSFSLEEARQAAELFLTSTGSTLLPITRLDGRPVGDGKPGPVATRLRELYLAYLDRPESGRPI